MAEDDNNQTTTYGDSEENKTETYNSKEQATAAYSDLQNKEFKSKSHGIGIGDKLNLRNNQYVITGIISEGTGEAVIYKIEDQSKKTFALKLYFEFSNAKEEPNFETLKRIKEITDPDILKLHDFGVGAEKYQGKYCYEICDFAKGGDLFSVIDFKNKYTSEFIEKYIVKEIFNGIKKLHDYKIYHCDLKPTNIFYKDTEQTDILIGDYGSAKAIDHEIEKEIRKTSTVKGTSTFLPPEQARGVISEKNDYYSFGFILLNLLYPESVSAENDFRQTKKEKFEKIIERQYNLMPIIDFNSRHRRLNNLIEGLTLINHNTRFGRKEVEQWLKGELVEVKYRASETSSIQAVKLGYATIKTDKDFINVLETQPNWYDDLIEDQDTFSTVKNWMDSYRDIPSRKVFDSMIKFYQPLGKDYVKESLLRYFDPEREIRIDMNSFNFFESSNIKKDVEAYISKLDDIWKITSIDKLKFYIFQLEFSLRQLKKLTSNESAIVVSSLIDKIYSVFGLIQKPFEDFKTETQTKLHSKDEAGSFRLLLTLFYAFSPERTFRDSKNISFKSIEDLGLFFVQNESSYVDKYLKVEKEKFLEKLNKKELNTLDYKQFIFEIFKDKVEAQVELINLTFDKHRDYKVNYKFYKSLNSFLAKKNITKDFTSRSDRNELYENKRGFFQPFKAECENFISIVTNKHNIATLTGENLLQIRKKFSGDSWKRYLRVYSGQFLALLLAIPLTYIVYGLTTHQLHVDKNWKFYWMEADAYQEKAQADYQIEQQKAIEDKTNSFLSYLRLQSIKLFSAGITSPAYGNRIYKTTFSRAKTKYIYFEVNVTTNQPSQRVDFKFYYTIYKDNIKYGVGSFDSYILPEWTSSQHSSSYGDNKVNNWKKGNYRVEIKANQYSLGTQYFTVN